MKRIIRLGFVGIAAIVVPFAAQAADMQAAPIYKGLPPAVAYYSWSGCYFGGHSGLAAGHTTWMDTLPIGTIDATTTGQTANTGR